MVFSMGRSAPPADVHSLVVQNVNVRLDRAFQAFFRRYEGGEILGYPHVGAKAATIV